jgi:hypothetical protein
MMEIESPKFEIGRASRRGRVEISEGAVSLKNVTVPT